ncbi:MAG: DUF2946 family protein [Kiloniellales bacterium]
MLAVLAQILIPLVHHPVHAATSALPWDVSAFCLADGQLPPTHRPRSDDREPDRPQDSTWLPCPICTALQQAGSCIAPEAVTIVYSLQQVARICYSQPTWFVAGLAILRSQPRAPPAPA